MTTRSNSHCTMCCLLTSIAPYPKQPPCLLQGYIMQPWRFRVWNSQKLKKCIFLPIKYMLKACRNTNFKVSRSLFGWKENEVNKEHIVHCGRICASSKLWLWSNIFHIYFILQSFSPGRKNNSGFDPPPLLLPFLTFLDKRTFFTSASLNVAQNLMPKIEKKMRIFGKVGFQYIGKVTQHCIGKYTKRLGK